MSSAMSSPASAAIQRYFEVSLYLMILTAFGALASTGGLDLPGVVLVGGALVVRGYLIARRKRWLIPQRWTTYLTLAYVAVYLADYFVVSQSLLTATVHLVLFGLVVRLFSVERERDHYLLAVLAFLMILAASLLTVDSLFLMSFGVFLLAAILTFVLMEMRHSLGSGLTVAREPREARRSRRLGYSLATLAPVLMGLVLAGGAAIFFLMPRSAAQYLSAYSHPSDFSVGFSEQVQLGRIGQIQQSNAVAMHIRIDGDEHGNYSLLWRGVGLSEFDGRTWSNPYRRLATPVRRAADGNFQLRALTGASMQVPHSRAIHYHVLMEPLGSNVFFLTMQPRLLAGNYRMVTQDAAGAVYNVDGTHPVSQYEADSELPLNLAEDLQRSQGLMPPEYPAAYLQVPALDIQIPQLARQITAGATNSYDKAAAIEQYLKTNFSYTLELPSTPPEDPVANFLFERKAGHCEYYASAMAVMLRSVGVPTRVITGFRGGEFNDVTRSYVVRESNAHAWVEVYFPGTGWVSFDPTPSTPGLSRTGWSRAMLYFDAMGSFWREWVVNYDSAHQKGLGEEVNQSTRAWVDRVRRWGQKEHERLLAVARSTGLRMARSPERWIEGGIASLLLVGLLVGARPAWRGMRRSWVQRNPEKAPKQAASLWYFRMLRVVARSGVKKHPADTARDVARRVNDPAMRARMVRFSEAYESARFDDDAEAARRLPELYEEIANGRK